MEDGFGRWFWRHRECGDAEGSPLLKLCTSRQKSLRWGSNPRPSECKSDVITTKQRGQEVYRRGVHQWICDVKEYRVQLCWQFAVFHWHTCSGENVHLMDDVRKFGAILVVGMV